MIKKIYYCPLVVILLLFSCKGRTQLFPIANYAKEEESFSVKYGDIQYDTLPVNLKTHNIKEGNKYVLEYDHSGTTFIDANNFESKYTETLLFQIDTISRKFEYCDTSLAKINCKYYWICIANKINKEIRNVRKGCIKGEIRKDTLFIEININLEFEFKSILKQSANRVIKYKTIFPLNDLNN